MAEENDHAASHTLVRTERGFEVDRNDLRFDFPDFGSHVSFIKSNDQNAYGTFTQGRLETARGGNNNYSNHSGNYTNYNGNYSSQQHPGNMVITLPKDCTYLPLVELKNVASIDYPTNLRFGKLAVEGASKALSFENPVHARILECDTDGKSLTFKKDIHTVKTTLNTDTSALSLQGVKSKHFEASTDGGILNVSGDIDSHHTELRSGTAAMSVKDVKGKRVFMRTDGGTLSAKNVLADWIDLQSGTARMSIGVLQGKRVGLTTDGGTVHLDKLKAEKGTLESGSGRMTVGDMEAGTAELITDGGTLDVNRARAGSIALQSGSAKTTVGDLQAGTARLTTDGGVIDVTNMDVDSARLESGSAPTAIGTATANSMALVTDGGKVRCTNVNSRNRLDITSGSGSIDGRFVFPRDGGHIESDGGTIRATLLGDPGTSSEFAMRSGSGSITAQFMPAIFEPSDNPTVFGGHLVAKTDSSNVTLDRGQGTEIYGEYVEIPGQSSTSVQIESEGGRVSLMWPKAEPVRVPADPATKAPNPDKDLSDDGDKTEYTPQGSDEEDTPAVGPRYQATVESEDEEMGNDM